MADLQAMLDQLGVAGDGPSDGSAPPAPTGAPTLTPPNGSFGIDDIAVLAENFLTKMNDLSMDTLNTSLKNDDQLRRNAANKAIAQIQEIAKKMAAAAKKQKMLGILGIIGKVFAVIAAVALTAATGGAAAPLAAALLVYAVADLTMTVADKVSQSKGGPSLSIDSLLTKGIEQLAKDAGASDADAEKIGQYGAMAIQIGIALAGVVGGGMSVFGEGGNLLQLSQKAMTVVKVLNGAGAVVNGANTIASGGIQIAKGLDDGAVADARHEQQIEQAVVDILKTFIDNTLDHMKAMVQALADQQNQVSDILSSTHQSAALVSHPNHA
jgi:hypothetical protein